MRKFTVGLLCGVSLFGLPWSALAQTSSTSTSPSPGDVETVVVTGSRVIANGNDSPSPTMVVTMQDMQQIAPGKTLADVLNSLPTFAGSRSSSSNPTTGGSAGGGNGAANQLNLRNLGPQRTLVLMDGNRVPPTLFNGVVDVDIIPQLLVQRVDVVTGGVSAVYGSDAISGVVNYVINHGFNGLRAEASGGVSGQGDDTVYDAAIAYGQKLGDRVHFELSYEHHLEAGIGRRTDRSWYDQAAVTGLGTAVVPYTANANLRQANVPYGGLINNGPLRGQTFQANGVLSALVHGTTTGSPNVELGGGGGYYDSGLVAGDNANQAFGRLDYDLADDLHAYLQLSADIKTNTTYQDYPLLSNVTLSTANAFLTPAQQTALGASSGVNTFTFSEMMSDMPRVQQSAFTKQWVLNAGFDGTLGGYKWNVNFTHGDSLLDSNLNNVMDRQKLAYALDAVNSGGNVGCNVTVTNPGLVNNCSPINVFGPTAVSAAAAKYVTDTVNYTGDTVLDDVSASISGSPFETWAGPVNIALSGESRDTVLSDSTTSTPTTFANCTGIRFNCTATTALNDYNFGQHKAPVSQNVWEVATEFAAPLLKDLPLVKSFDINGAARYTDYNTSGEYWTWKLGAEWHVDDSLSLRATRSRDIRAPNLYDLFAPVSQVPVTHTDLLTNTSQTVPSVNLSNPNLKAEIGNTWTAGAVWTVSDEFNIAADYYHIIISRAITQVDGSTPGIQQACYASGGTSPYCALQIRPFGITNTSPANQVTGWDVEEINISTITSWGVDLEANYHGELFGRRLTGRLLGEWQPHVYYVQPGVQTVDQGNVGFGPLGLSAGPALRLVGLIGFQPIDHLTVNLEERWRSAMALAGDPTLVWAPGSNHMSPFATTAINVAWDQATDFGNLQPYFNVQNLLDEAPPPGAYYGNANRAGLRDGFAVGDDVIGRYFTAGIRFSY